MPNLCFLKPIYNPSIALSLVKSPRRCLFEPIILYQCIGNNIYKMHEIEQIKAEVPTILLFGDNILSKATIIAHKTTVKPYFSPETTSLKTTRNTDITMVEVALNKLSASMIFPVLFTLRSQSC